MKIKSPNALPVVALVLLGLLIFFVGLAASYTFIDEVYFADPVINFLTGHSYATTAWNVTGQFETHVSSAPAYSLLLLLWLKIFGITQTAVRSLPAVLALGSAVVFWRACLRSGLIKSGGAGAIVICVVLLDYGYAFAYTCGRPDPLSALLMSAMFYFFSLQNKRAAFGAIGVIALLLPFVQWGCVIYLFLLSVALLFISPKKFLPYVVVAGAGAGAGLLIQKAAYVHFGIWDTWMNTVKSEGSGNLASRIENRMTWDALLHHHSNTIPKDFSVLVILAGLACIYLWSRLRQRQHEARPARSAWIIAVVVSAGMFLVGKFPTYYGWMLCFPLAAVLGIYFDQALVENRMNAKIAVVIAVLACSVGLPLQIGLAAHDWKDHNPAAITAWLGPKISTNDVVYCDYPFYFIAKERAGQVFAGRYFNLLTPKDFNRITLVIFGKNGSDWNPSTHPLTNATVVGNWTSSRSDILGNDWKYGFLSAPNYDCTVYRLKEPMKP
ncbi:MAG TPA: hypothetical protein VIK53_16160 [Verrucomicrobiae bacterium]